MDDDEVIEGIRALRARLDELHHLVADGGRPGEWLAGRAADLRLPAWRRPTKGEVRWPVTIVVATATWLQTSVPDRLELVRPSWILPAAMGALLIVLVAADPNRINRESALLRMIGLAIAAMLSLINGYSVAALAVDITQGTMKLGASQLLITGAVIWLTNVVVFGLWYWEFDRGGPAARANNTGNRFPDFQFPQMTSPPGMVSKDWEPGFIDYFYLAFTNASAFSPTDTMPMSRWAKLAMTVQSVISIVTVALVVSRAVNILPAAG